MPDIRDITEEKIFQTLGRGVPMCNILSEADGNTVRSILSTEQAVKQMTKGNEGHIRGLEIIIERQKLNLEGLRGIKKDMGCK